MIGSSGDGLHFGMCRHVVQKFGQVVPTCDDPISTDHHRSHRNFIAAGGVLRLFKGTLHVVFVRHMREFRRIGQDFVKKP